jgi:hypothetical protein
MKMLLTTVTTAAVLLLTSVPTSAITNGTIDTTHDYVGAMIGLDPGGTPRLCSGSLIAEGVFLTAGHCGVLTDVSLHFGDDLAAGALVFSATAVIQHPQFDRRNFGKQFDVGLVLFDQGSADLEIGNLAPENYVSGFSKAELAAATFETVGHGLSRGDTNGNSEPLTLDTQRRIATQSYLNMHNQFLGLSIQNNRGDGGGCSGDSGGPHLLDDYIVSVTSNGDANCVATDNTQRVDLPEIRDWILGIIA